MASPSPQLEAALAQFAGQQGVTQDQVAQLRNAISADAVLLAQFDQQAQAGSLRGFALQSAGSSAPNLVGTYDIQSGVVTLPTASLPAAGTTAGSDLKGALQVQQMSVAFAHSTYQDAARTSHPVTQDMVSNLQSSINNSPFLADEIKKVATTIDASDTHNPKRANLEGFGFVGPGQAAGGTYDGNQKIMNLPPIGLQTRTAANPGGSFNADSTTFVLGHEIQHSFNHAAKSQATATFLSDIERQAKVQGPVHDYTNELRAYIQAGREDEAKAEIAGWNALLSLKRQGNPTANGVDLMLTTTTSRTEDFIERDPTSAVPKAITRPGLSFNQDGSLSQTPSNIAAMGQHYFDRPSPLYAQPGQRAVGLGEHVDQAGNLQPTADYTNYYGTWAVEQIARAEDRANVQYQGARPRVTIDMAGLGLREHLIENEGLDRGPNKAPLPYYDSSTTPATLHHFDHTQDGSVNPAHNHTYVPVVPAAASAHSSPSAARPLSPDDAAHPNHDMLEQIRSGVRKIEESVGKPWDEMSERVNRSLLAACKDNRDAYPDKPDYSLAGNELSRVDLVVMGRNGNLFAVEGRQDDPAHRRAHVQLDQAINIPVEQSDQKLLAANRAIAQQRELTQQQELTRGMGDPAQTGPTM
ncbi:XVIPCD domain-containing protein [Xanthomonas sp. WHRI 10064A]|uniref:XVIPCD domain-containing protein n=1 Tax=unclassified Xanthomonas TaxID=2643310 RepID=UPI002B2374E6|nr:MULTISPECIES: XVIPCD domain-containing protein [unclassified Xanthomonas]MEA9586773.1 XVIPCD domain-containing protein [Xanthomonas sp. WHRI 10064B]MEA9615964.1 XVIPCD domain-containing protein [Xanthomonas sp. WHRI 10064A]